MIASEDRRIIVTGATGRLGGAVARHLLRDGWRVRALTRRPDGPEAQALAASGAEVVRADMDHPDSLRSAFRGAYGAFSLQNPMTGGVEAAVRQGGRVADAAAEAGVRHLVYASAGFGQAGTGVGSWDSKLRVEERMMRLGLPLTILRPMALMELMTDRAFYPALSTWHMMPKLMGASKEVAWLAADDFGAVAARVFADPDRYVGQDLRLAADLRSIDDCRSLYRSVMGRSPARVPVPVWLFERFVGPDPTAMWRWLRTAHVDADPATVRAIHPEALDVEGWLRRQEPRARRGSRGG